MLYDYIDNSGDYYSNHVEKEFRSRMNVPFRICVNERDHEDLEKRFLTKAKAAGLIELAGHRTVGGIRASIYNAMPVEGVQALIDFMKAFREANPSRAEIKLQ